MLIEQYTQCASFSQNDKPSYPRARRIPIVHHFAKMINEYFEEFFI
ncbi:MAG: hypothetical protein CNLJKLNK_01377 [Holosporales bacterium]